MVVVAEAMVVVIGVARGRGRDRGRGRHRGGCGGPGDRSRHRWGQVVVVVLVPASASSLQNARNRIRRSRSKHDHPPLPPPRGGTSSTGSAPIGSLSAGSSSGAMTRVRVLGRSRGGCDQLGGGHRRCHRLAECGGVAGSEEERLVGPLDQKDIALLRPPTTAPERRATSL